MAQGTTLPRILCGIAAALLVAGCGGRFGPEQEKALRARVTGYLEALQAAQFARAYQEFWKTQPRRVEEMEALLALQWQNDGTFVRYEIAGVTGKSASEAEVSVSVTMSVHVPGSGEEKETTSLKTWTWSTQNGSWFFHGDYHGPG